MRVNPSKRAARFDVAANAERLTSRSGTAALRELNEGMVAESQAQAAKRRTRSSRTAVAGYLGELSQLHRDHCRAHRSPAPPGTESRYAQPALRRTRRPRGPDGQGLSTKTVANIHGVLHKALKDAVKRGKVPRNVVDAVDPPKPERPQTDVWDVNQLRAFLTHVRDDDFYAAWLLFATTGMRRGEVAGLTWHDLDLDTGTVRIGWTLGVVDNKPMWKPRPKSAAGNRVLALDPAAVEALRARREAQTEHRAVVEPGWRTRQTDWRGQHRGEVVSTWPDGSIINPERYTAWFAKHCICAGLPRIRLHDVRHTYASVVLAQSSDWHEIKVISERLGHASIGITLDTYAHVLPVADERTAHTLASHILGHT